MIIKPREENRDLIVLEISGNQVEVKQEYYPFTYKMAGVQDFDFYQLLEATAPTKRQPEYAEELRQLYYSTYGMDVKPEYRSDKQNTQRAFVIRQATEELQQYYLIGKQYELNNASAKAWGRVIRTGGQHYFALTNLLDRGVVFDEPGDFMDRCMEKDEHGGYKEDFNKLYDMYLFNKHMLNVFNPDEIRQAIIKRIAYRAIRIQMFKED
jgi:hypothetical protein